MAATNPEASKKIKKSLNVTEQILIKYTPEEALVIVY